MTMCLIFASFCAGVSGVGFGLGFGLTLWTLWCFFGFGFGFAAMLPCTTSSPTSASTRTVTNGMRRFIKLPLLWCACRREPNRPRTRVRL